MGASIKEIAGSATDAARIAGNAVAAAESTTETVSRLGESSGEIGEVIKVIPSIAEQTNLLALHAPIEAARAGAIGRDSCCDRVCEHGYIQVVHVSFKKKTT